MHFALLNNDVIQLLAIKFCCDVLVRIQKALMDNANGKTPDSSCNFSFERKCLGLWYDQAIEMIILDNHKGTIFHLKFLFSQETDQGVAETALNTL